MTFDVARARRGFPALGRTVDGQQAAYLDGPGGTQVHSSAIEAMSAYMVRGGSNLGGPFVTSTETDVLTDEARVAVADLFGAMPSEIAFGQNMTSLTFSVSRALARTWSAGDNIVLTRLDHDANVSTWTQAAAEAQVEVRFADFDIASGCELTVEAVRRHLDGRTKLVAFTHASNAVGTITPVADIVAAAHEVGALTFVDAVHYTPHGLVDVKATGTDFLVASAYKWFGPHTGCLYGRHDLLESLEAYRLRPAPAHAPDKWETGTQSFESLAGVTSAVDYIASFGTGPDRRARLVSSYKDIGAYEAALSSRFLAGVAEMPRVNLFGKTGSEGRTPTFAIEVDGVSSGEVSEVLGAQGIFVWSGNYYAVEVMKHLNREQDGLVRIGFVHYNTLSEVDRVLGAIEDLP
ncbi:MAG: cysteine desulfurase-like protein [Acidimicrobiia bacterium]